MRETKMPFSRHFILGKYIHSEGIKIRTLRFKLRKGQME